MIRRAIVAALTLATSVPTAAQAVDDPNGNDRFYCQERKLGTWFYCGKPKAEPAQAPEIAPEPPAASTATEQLDKVTAELRELKAKAILEPTPENVTAYVRYQRQQLDRASMFGDVWQRALWQNPEIDYTLQRPVSTLAKQSWTDNRKGDRDRALVAVGQRYGLFYFFAQGCGACRIFSPILKSVADSHGITVRAISMDGGPDETFPRYQVDSGQRERMGLPDKVTPAVVLFDSQNRHVIPIGYGVMAADELMDRIYLLTSRPAGTDY